MRKETINTFGEGLIMDLYPLTTPSNTLTNCLNGTIITYNGNEFVLQNDMGNGEVHTAYLDKGYVPVGMKEHGGIIYVAAHNPITKKSLIGSFPSPLQLFNETDLNISDVNIDFNDFINYKGDIPFIKLEYYKEKLFVDKDSGIARKFYPGDKFIITVESIDLEIIDAAKKGIINFKLGVVTSSGTLDYLDDKKLRLYPEDKGYWIFCYLKGKTVEDLLKDSNLVQIYNAKTSGELVLIIEYKTIQAFDLIRQYTFENDLITVKLFGKLKSYIEDISGYTNLNENIGLIEDNSFEVKDEIVFLGTNHKEHFNISPVTVYGVLDRLRKNGIIDFSLIKPNTEHSDEWRYYVTDTYLKIGWNYDYYNVDNTLLISKILFTFIDFKLSDLPLEELSGYSVNITKEYYNGNFEEVFSFGLSGIMKNYIYIVRIDRYLVNKDGVETKMPNPFYRLVYTGAVFNKYYATISDYNTLRKSQLKVSLPFTFETNSSIQNNNTYQYSQRVGPDPNWKPVALPNPIDFKQSVESEDTPTANFRYGISKTNSYTGKITIDAHFNYTNSYAGRPKENELQSYIRDNINLSLSNIDNSEMLYSNSTSSLIHEMTIESSKDDINFSTSGGNVGEYTFNCNTNRCIISNAGAIRNDSYEFKGLLPLYGSNTSSTDRNKLIGFASVSGGVSCFRATEDRIEYNATLKDYGETISGISVGGGDDSSLSTANINVGNPCAHIFAGYDGLSASLGFEGRSRKSASSLNGWPKGEDGDEIDKSDNFLIVTWRSDDGKVKLINLGSRRTETRTIGSSSIIRADLMVKCYLSLMLVVKDTKFTGFTVGANASNYVFHKAFNSKIDATVEIRSSERQVDFYLDGDTKSIQTRMEEWVKKIQGLNDYLPVFVINSSITDTKTLEFGNDIDFTGDLAVLQCFLNAYTPISKISTDYDATKIYLGTPTGVASSDGIMPLKMDLDGLYIPSSSTRVIHDWYNRPSTLPNDINNMFVLTENKELLVRAGGPTSNGRWRKKKDSHAPDILYNTHFGNTKLFN